MSFNKIPIKIEYDLFLIRLVLCSVLLFLNAAVCELNAQAPKSREVKPPAAAASFCKSVEENNTILKIRTYLEKAKSFKDSEIRGKSTINLSALLFECDPEFAMTALLTTWQLLTREIADAQAQKNNTATNSPDELRKLDRLIFTNQSLQRYLISKLQKLDRQTAAQLIKNLSEKEKLSVDFLTAEDDLGMGELTPQKLNQIRQLFMLMPVLDAVQFLFRVKSQNPQAADILFLELLKAIKTNSNLSLNEVMESGVYLFTSRIYLNAIKNTSVLYTYLPAREVLILDLTLLREDVSREALKSYMNFVAGYLTPPVSELNERTHRYVFGRLMLEHISIYTPELTGLMEQALRVHSVNIADKFKDDGFYNVYRRINTPEEADYFDQNLEDLTKTVGSDERDDKAVRLAAHLYRAGKLEKIDKVTEQISKPETKALIINLALYARALKFAGNKEFEKSLAVVSKIDNPTLKAIIGVELISAWRESKRPGGQYLDDLFYEIFSYSKKINDNFAPSVFFSLAKMSCQQNAGLCNELVSEGVLKLNRSENWNLPDWQITILTPTLPVASYNFPLKKVQDLDILNSLDFLVKNTGLDFEATAFSIREERIKAELFLMLSKKFLGEARKSQTKTNNKG